MSCSIFSTRIHYRRVVLAFVSMTDSITTFPKPFMTAIEMLSLCTSMPICLVPVIGCSFLEKVELNIQNRTPEGAPPYIASEKRTSEIGPDLRAVARNVAGAYHVN